MNKHITMEEYKTEFLSQYVIELTKWIMRKFDYDEKRSYNEFISSETYQMLSDLNCGMWEYGYGNIFDMWVAEKITGNPRNAEFLRME